MGRVEAVYFGEAESFALPDGSGVRSAIRKRAAPGRIALGAGGIAGDECVDRAHGGPNRALHAFPIEHYARLESIVGRPLPAPTFGENLAVRGCDERGRFVGDVLRVGEALLQVTMPTERCGIPGRHVGVPELLKHLRAERFSGFYLRVLEPGEVWAGASIEEVEAGDRDWSLDALNRMLFEEIGDPERVEAVDAIEVLAPEWKQRVKTLHARRRIG